MAKNYYWIFGLATKFKSQQLRSRMNEVIENVTDPMLKKSLVEKRDEYRERIDQLNGQPLTGEISDQIKQEHYRFENLVHKMKIMDKNPVKHILYCKSPGCGFREEIDISRVGASYEDDYLAYRKELNFYIDKALAKHDLEKYLYIHHYNDRSVEPEGWFIYSDAIQSMIKKRLRDYKIEFCLDTVTQDGEVIETEKIDIIDFFKRNPKYFQQAYIVNATNEYISASLKRFVKESCWQFRFYINDHYRFYNVDPCIYDLDDPDNWPSLKDDGTWIADEMICSPEIWFGLKDENPGYSWILNGSDLNFWFDEDNEKHFIARHTSWDVGCYSGYLPDMKAIRESCPILLEANDTPESIDKKIQAFFVKQYKEVQENESGNRGTVTPETDGLLGEDQERIGDKGLF